MVKKNFFFNLIGFFGHHSFHLKWNRFSRFSSKPSFMT